MHKEVDSTASEAKKNSASESFPEQDIAEGKDSAVSEFVPNSVKMEVKPGVLYLVAVPIGNLDDFTPRAWHVLEQAEYIACEEVQSARRLLQLHNVKAKLISYR